MKGYIVLKYTILKVIDVSRDYLPRKDEWIVIQDKNSSKRYRVNNVLHQFGTINSVIIEVNPNTECFDNHDINRKLIYYK